MFHVKHPIHPTQNKLHHSQTGKIKSVKQYIDINTLAKYARLQFPVKT